MTKPRQPYPGLKHLYTTDPDGATTLFLSIEKRYGFPRFRVYRDLLTKGGYGWSVSKYDGPPHDARYVWIANSGSLKEIDEFIAPVEA